MRIYYGVECKIEALEQVFKANLRHAQIRKWNDFRILRAALPLGERIDEAVYRYSHRQHLAPSEHAERYMTKALEKLACEIHAELSRDERICRELRKPRWFASIEKKIWG